MKTIKIIENKSITISGKVLGNIYGANIFYKGVQVFIPVSYPTREGVEKEVKWKKLADYEKDGWKVKQN